VCEMCAATRYLAAKRYSSDVSTVTTTRLGMQAAYSPTRDSQPMRTHILSGHGDDTTLAAFPQTSMRVTPSGP